MGIFGKMIKKKSKPDYKRELRNLNEELSYIRTKQKVQQTKAQVKKMKWKTSAVGKITSELAKAGKTYGNRRGGSSIFDNGGFGGLDEFKTTPKRKKKKRSGRTIVIKM